MKTYPFLRWTAVSILALAVVPAFAATEVIPPLDGHHVSWGILGSLLAACFFVELLAVRAVIHRGVFGALLPTLIVAVPLPLIVYALSHIDNVGGLEIARKMQLTGEGLSFSISSHVRLFSIFYFLFCWIVSAALLLPKLTILRFAATAPVRFGPIAALLGTSFLSAAVFMGGIVFEQQRDVATFQDLAALPKYMFSSSPSSSNASAAVSDGRAPSAEAAAAINAINAVKGAADTIAPALNYYQNLKPKDE